MLGVGGGGGGRERSTKCFCNLSLGLEKVKDVHSLCKDFALLIFEKQPPS